VEPGTQQLEVGTRGQLSVGEDAAQAATELKAFKALETRSSRKRRSKRIRILVIIAAALVVVIGGFVLLSSLLSPPDQNTAPLAEEVTSGNFDEVLDSTGKLEAVEQVTITPEIDGTVAEVRVSEGGSVAAGQVLFTIDNPDLDRQVESAQRGLDGANVGYNGAVSARNSANAQASTAYQAWLDAKAAADAAAAAPPQAPTDPTDPSNPSSPTAPSASDSSLQPSPDAAWAQYQSAKAQADGAQTQVDQAWLQVKEAEAALEQSRNAASKREVSSPIAGQVVLSNIERGTKLSTLAQSGKVPMQIANLNQMVVSVPINEIDILKLGVGQAAEVSFDALDGYLAQATVRSIATTPSSGGSDQLSPGGGIVTYQVDLLIESPDPRLKIGMSASATVFINSFENALIVNALAITENEQGTTVTVLEADGSQRVVPVKVLASDDSRAAVEGGLRTGDRVVLSTPDSTSIRGGFSSGVVIG
jgi:HlyD family secretion protein